MKWLDRVQQTYQSFKAAPPSPGALMGRGAAPMTFAPLSWEGWPDRGGTGRGLAPVGPRGNGEDERRAKTAVTSPWVYRGVNALARELSAAALQVQRRVEHEGMEGIDNHPFEVLWARPNPCMGRGFLMQWWTWQIMLSGEGYLFLRPVGGNLVEVWPVPSWFMEPVPDDKEFIRGYWFRAGANDEPRFIERRYIVYSRLPNPFDIRRGLSPLVALMTDVEGDLAMARWNKGFFSKENAAPSGMITVPRDTLDSDLEVIRQQIWDYFGSGQRRVGVARAGDMAWTAFDRSQKDMEFLEGRQFTQKLVDTVLGFPEGYWSDKANRANAEAARGVVIENTVWPLLVMLAEDLNAQAGPNWLKDDEVIGFTDIRPSNLEKASAEFQILSPAMTLNEIRRRFGNLDNLPDYRGRMLLKEVEKGAPMPGSIPEQELAEYVAEQEAGAAEEATPAQGAPDEAPDVVEAQTEELKALDLDRWQRKALKALRARGSAAVTFQSDAIDPGEAERIAAALKAAQSADEVRAAFKAADALEAVWPEAMQWARLALGEGA